MTLSKTLSCGKIRTTVHIGTVSGLWLCRRPWRLKTDFGWNPVNLWTSHVLFPYISWMCKKQTSVSHSSTESEIMSLDPGLRMDGIPALDLWCLVIEWSVAFFLEPNKEIQRNSAGIPAAWHTIQKTHQHPNQDSNSAQRCWVIQCRICFLNREVFSLWRYALHFWRWWSGVIKIIIKGRSPTMRHVSRTHRVALDWLFDRTNLDPKIQIKYVDTKKQTLLTYWRRTTSHVMTGGIFSIGSISAFSGLSAALETMSKRMQQGTGGEKIVPKSKPMLNLVSHAAASSSTASSSSASNRPGILRAPSQQGSNLTAKRCRETCSWRFKSEYRSVEFSSVASRCKDERQCEETRCYRNKPETWIFKPVQGDFPQKIQTTSTTQSGRLITAYLVLTFHISRKSSRICDSNMVASQETKWKTSKRILRYGECLCLSLCIPQFILERIIWRICILPKKSTTMNSETNVRSDKGVGHSSIRNSR